MAFKVLSTADLNQEYFITPDWGFVPSTGIFYFGSNDNNFLHSITTLNSVPASVVDGGGGGSVYPLVHDSVNNILYISTGNLVRKVDLGGPSVTTLFDYIAAGDTGINAAILDVPNDTGYFQGNLKVWKVTLSTGAVGVSWATPDGAQIGNLGESGFVIAAPFAGPFPFMDVYTNKDQTGNPGTGGVAYEIDPTTSPGFGGVRDMGQSGGIAPGNLAPLTSAVVDPTFTFVYVGVRDQGQARIIKMDEPNWALETVLTLPTIQGTADWMPMKMKINAAGTFLYVVCVDAAHLVKSVLFKIDIANFTVRDGVVLDSLLAPDMFMDDPNDRIYVTGYLQDNITIRWYSIENSPFSGIDPNFTFDSLTGYNQDKCGVHAQGMTVYPDGSFALISTQTLTNGIVKKIDLSNMTDVDEADFGVGNVTTSLSLDLPDDHFYATAGTQLKSVSPSVMVIDGGGLFSEGPVATSNLHSLEYGMSFLLSAAEVHWWPISPWADEGFYAIPVNDGEVGYWMVAWEPGYHFIVANGSNAGSDAAKLVKLHFDGSEAPVYFDLIDVAAKNALTGMIDEVNNILYFTTEDWNELNCRLWKYDLTNSCILGSTPVQSAVHGTYAGAVDPTTGYVYLASRNSPVRVARVRLEDFVLVDFIALAQDEPMSAAARNGVLYIYGGDPGNPPKAAIAKVNVAAAAVPFQEVLRIDRPDYLWNVNHAEVKAANGFMYAMNSGGDYQFRDLPLNTFQPFSVWDNTPQAVMFGLDRVGGFAFLMAQGVVRKIDLSNFSNPLTFTYSTATFGTNPQSVAYDPVTNTVWHSVMKNGSPFNNTLFKIDASTMLQISNVTKPQHTNSWTPRIVLDPTNDAIVFARNRILGPNPTVEIFRWNMSDFPNGELIAPTIDNHFIANQDYGVAINGKAYIPIYSVAGDFGKLYEYTTNTVTQTNVELFSDYPASTISAIKEDVAQGFVYVGIAFSGPSVSVPLIRMDATSFTRTGLVTFGGFNSVSGGSAFGDGNGYFYALLNDTVNPQKLAYIQVGVLPGVPLAPTNLRISTGTTSQMMLEWDDNAIDETGFKIERSTDGINFVQIDTVGVDIESYNAVGLTQYTTYWFRVRAYNGNGDSDYTNYAIGTTEATPNPGFNFLRAVRVGENYAGSGWETSLFISSVTGKIYHVAKPFVGPTGTSFLYELNPNTFSPIRKLNLGDNNTFNSAASGVVDDANGFIYTASQTTQLKISLTTFQILNGHIAGLNGYAEAVVLDAAGGFVYYAVDSVLYKLNTSDMTEDSSLPCPSDVIEMLGDIPNGYVYLITDAVQVTRINVTSMTDAGAVNLGAIDYVEGASIDLVNGVLYVTGSEGGVAALWRVDLPSFTMIPGTTTFLPDETQPFISFVDNTNNFLFAISSLDQKVVQFTLSPFARTTRITFAGSVNNFYYECDKGINNRGYAMGNVDPNPLPALLEFGLVGAGGPPLAPTLLVVSNPTASTLTLDWQDNSIDETGFKIEQSPNGLTLWNQVFLTGPDVEQYVVPGLLPTTTYYFRVRATNGFGDSAYTNVANGTTLAAGPVPTPPTALIATVLDMSRIQLDWTPGTGELGYKVELSFNGVDFAQYVTFVGQVATYNVVALSPETPYWIRIRSYNLIGDSAYSNTVTATTQAPPVDSIVRPFPTDPAIENSGLPQDTVRGIWDVREVMRDAAGKLFSNRRSEIQPDFLDYLASLGTRINAGVTLSGCFLDGSLVAFILLQRDRAVAQYNLNTTPGDYEAGLVLSALSGLLE